MVLAGCVTGSVVAIGTEHFSPTASANVTILEASPDPSTYKVIGTVSASGAPAAAKGSVVGKVQEYAAGLGADAVIISAASRVFRVNSDFGPMYGWDVSGVAIKFIK